MDSYAVGSASRLVGHCAVFQVFLGPRWRWQDRQQCLRAVRDACDWLEAKAKEHGLSLRLTTDPAAVYLLSRVPIPARALSRPDRWRAYRPEEDHLCRRLETLRPQLAKSVGERLRRLARKPDQVCLIAHIPRSGIGFAMPTRNDLHVESELEICACGRASGAAIYAHELLHLFGAPDLYFNPWWVLTRKGEADEWTRSFQQRMAVSGFEIFRAYFGNSIMSNTAPGIERLAIDPITARAIGWRKPDRPFMKAVARVEDALGKVVEHAIDEL